MVQVGEAWMPSLCSMPEQKTSLRAPGVPSSPTMNFGTKIFITYGEHDMTENIVHLVLARVTGAPEGVKGIRLFVVPKFLLNADGSLGARNDVHCVSIEHKLGIKASPTAVLQYGDGTAASIAGSAGPGAVGYLVGEENRGLEYMFIMMNSARYAVGMQGIAIADRAYQRAVAYARERVQSRPVDGSLPASGPIIHHPDVRRMLMTMRALTEGCRAMASVAAATYDGAHHHPDAQTRKEHQAFYEFLVPLVKGYSTEMSQEVTSLGVQVHGGMGFIEETGAAQHMRDARILTIYEGTRPSRPTTSWAARPCATAAPWRAPWPRASSRPRPSCAPAAPRRRWPWPRAWAPRAPPIWKWWASSPRSTPGSTSTPSSPAAFPT